MRVVPRVGLVLDMRCRDGNPAFAFFGRFVYGAVLEVCCVAFFGLAFGYGGCEGRFAVVDVPDCSDVYVRFVALEDCCVAAADDLRLGGLFLEDALEGVDGCAQGAGGVEEGAG